MRMVFIGDSLTYGYRIRPDRVWVKQLAQEKGIEIINKGMNGDTTGGMLRRFLRDVVKYEPTHVLIFGGANDIVLDMPLDTITENIEKMVNTARKEGIIPLIGITMEMDELMASREWADGTDYKKANKQVLLLREWILNYCNRNNLVTIDFYEAYHEALSKEPVTDYFLDGLHPTEKGQEVLKDTAIKAFRKLIKE
ncbi:MAG: GDSL-type esterase/lipase family protein [Peptostreptococcales bacterium]